MKFVLLGGIAQHAADTLTTGTILTAYALCLGANNLFVGILSAIPFLMNIMHIYAAYLIEKGFSVKKLSVYTSFASKPFYLLIALLAFFQNSTWAIYALVLFLTLSYAVGNISGGLWRPWMKALIPEQLTGRFFADRFKWMMIAKIVCFIFAAVLLKIFTRYFPENQIFAYSILLTLTFCFGSYNAYTLTKVQNIPLNIKEKQKSFIQKIFYTFKNKNFVSLMTTLGLLKFTLNFATPFFTVFLLKQLNISMFWILLLNLLSQIIFVLVIKKLGKFTDKNAHNQNTLFWSVFLFSLSFLGFAMLSNFLSLSLCKILISLIIIYIVMGLGNAGITLETNNIPLLYVPQKFGYIYLTVNSAVIDILSALGALTGSFALYLCEIAEHTFMLSGWFIFFSISFLLCLLTMLLIKNLKKA